MKRENEFRYLKLAHILREQILSGYIKPGEFLMSENDLCKQYGMSRTSVRKSLEQLLNEGLIIKKVGQGTIVSPDVVIQPSQNKVLRIFAAAPSHFFDICMPHMIEAFKVDYPHVEVKCLSFTSNEFWDSVNTSVDLGLKPDLLFLTDRLFNEMDSKEDYIDLQHSLTGSFDLMYPRLRDAWRIEQGAVKAAPVTFSSVYLAYNPELFKQYDVPEPTENWTTEDFLQAAERLTRDTNGDGIADVYGLSISSSLSRWPVFALQNGVRFTRPDEREPLLNTLNFMHEILYKRRVAALSPRTALNLDAFARGKAAMVLTTTIELAGSHFTSIPFQPRMASLPFGKRKDTMLIANCMMIPEQSDEKELALRFLQKAISVDMQEKLSRETGFLSVLRKVNESIWESHWLEKLHIHHDIIENSFFLHEILPDVQIADALETEMMMYWSGMDSATECTDRLLGIVRQPRS
ncbi:extracellular solute-binding protein [Marinicrinis lubricantis]|uniref:Extracellular solute-binding protein n=1 Tax=Marinicrinis lubricantis TaxID=2086470 RepID=A0ABW1IRJ1_9BACL